MTFSARVSSPSGIETSWTTATADDRSLECSIPKEFAGPNTGFSPEDFYLLALMNCYVATLKVIAVNSKMSFSTIDGTAKLTLDRDQNTPTPWMTAVNIKFVVTGVENEERFRRMMDRVSKQCMIVNSVKTTVRFEFEITTV